MTSSVAARTARVLALSVVCGALSCASAVAQGRTDVVVLMNGDRITCEIKRLERGQLTVRTDSMSTVQIEWEDIVRVSSVERFEVELESGEKHIGTLLPPTQDGQLEVAGEEATDSLDLRAVVRLVPMGESFFRRLEGSFDAGYSFTKANDATQWNLAAEVTHRAERLETRVSGSSLITGQEDVDTTSRTDLGIQVNRFLGQRWQATILGQFQQNEELQLNFRSLTGGGFGRQVQTSSLITGQEDVDTTSRTDLGIQVNRFLGQRWQATILGQFQQNEELQLNFRSLTGGGFGRQVVQTNTTLVSLLGGVAYSREQFEDLSGNNEAVAVAAVQLQTFRFDFPKTDISTTFYVLPSLTEGGRVRLELNSRFRREVLRDFYWSVSFFDSFDSEPPLAGAERNDYGIISSFGWAF